ncbi:MAG: hypothetical protein HZA01_16600 [Nitrospinae bacterium]|nr:hypothetical protein [Nitrospinota bacterium]
MRTIQRRRRALFTLVAAIMLLAMAEIGLRVPAYIFRRDAGYSALPRDKGATVFCIGDSFTFGTGVNLDEAYPQALERLLHGAGLTNIRVVNLGRPGHSSAYALYCAAQAIMNEPSPYLAVLSGWNANDNDFLMHAREKKQSAPLSAYVDQFLNWSRLYRLASQIATLRGRSEDLGNVKLVPLSPAMRLYNFRAYQEICRKNLEQIVHISRQRRVPLMLLNYPVQKLPPNEYNLELEYYHLMHGKTTLEEKDYVVHDRRPGENAIDSVIRDVAERGRVPLVDVNTAFKEAAEQGLYQEDWHHPTARGHEIMARRVFSAITQNFGKIAASQSPRSRNNQSEGGKQ